jgi:hypothetical protein
MRLIVYSEEGDSEFLQNCLYRNKRRHIPGKLNLHRHGRENLKSHAVRLLGTSCEPRIFHWGGGGEQGRCDSEAICNLCFFLNYIIKIMS